MNYIKYKENQILSNTCIQNNIIHHAKSEITYFQLLLYKEQMTFSEFKTALQNYEENEKSCNPRDNQDNVMFSKQRFTGKCFKCDKQGHESSECRMKTEKWCVKCTSKTHNTKDCRANKKDAAKAVAEPEKDDTETHTFIFTMAVRTTRARGARAP